MNYFGGKKVLFQKAKTLQGEWSTEIIPEQYVAKKGNITLLAMGKIRRFGEGCACPINALSSRFLEVLTLQENEFLIADTDAGIEHLGRGVDKGCDVILVVIDPSGESIRLAGKIEQMAEELHKKLYYVLNNIDAETEELLLGALEEDKVITSIPHDRTILTTCLRGDELHNEMTEIEQLVDFLEQLQAAREAK
jgi:CO dehydrogenase maturation factor